MKEKDKRESEIAILKANKIVPPSATAEQVAYFFEVCKRKKLDPFLKQVHMIERSEKLSNGSWSKSYTIQASIDGMRAIAQRNVKIINYERSVKHIEVDGSTKLYGCCRITTEDRGSYYDELPYEEYVQKTREGTPNAFWKRMPETMIKKCAEESVLRMVAPEDLSDIYGDDEMMQAENEEQALLPESQYDKSPEYVQEVPELKRPMPAPPEASSNYNEVKTLIDNGGKWNGKVYDKGKIFINGKTFMLTPEEIELLRKPKVEVEEAKIVKEELEFDLKG